MENIKSVRNSEEIKTHYNMYICIMMSIINVLHNESVLDRNHTRRGININETATQLQNNLETFIDCIILS